MPESPFIEVAAADAVLEGKFIRVEVEGHPILLARVQDRIYAVEDTCSHEDYPLSFGCIAGDSIKCSLHGSRFSLLTGEPRDEPADTSIRTYAVEVSEGRVWVDPTQSAQ